MLERIKNIRPDMERCYGFIDLCSKRCYSMRNEKYERLNGGVL